MANTGYRPYGARWERLPQSDRVEDRSNRAGVPPYRPSISQNIWESSGVGGFATNATNIYDYLSAGSRGNTPLGRDAGYNDIRTQYPPPPPPPPQEVPFDTDTLSDGPTGYQQDNYDQYLDSTQGYDESGFTEDYETGASSYDEAGFWEDEPGYEYTEDASQYSNPVEPSSYDEAGFESEYGDEPYEYAGEQPYVDAEELEDSSYDDSEYYEPEGYAEGGEVEEDEWQDYVDPPQQYAQSAVGTGTMTDESPERPAQDEWQDYVEPSAPAATAAPKDEWQDYVEPEEATLGGGLSVAGRSFGEAAVRGLGEAFEQSSIVSPNPYDVAKPEEQGEAARGPYAGEIRARERQQARNRAAAQADIDAARAVPFEERTGAKIGAAIKGVAPVVTEQEKATYPITSMTSGMIGSSVAPLAIGAAGTAVGGPVAGLVAAGGYMAAQSRGAEYDRASKALDQQIEAANKAGDTAGAQQLTSNKEDRAAKAANLSAVVNGSLGVLPVAVILRPVKDIAPGAVGRLWAMADHAWKSGVTFAGTGEAQQYLAEQMAKEYDPKATYEFDYKRVISALLAGGALGAGGAAKQRRPSEPPPPEQQPPAPSPPAQGQLPLGDQSNLPYLPKAGGPQEAQIGGGEAQPRLPEAPTPPPARAGTSTQPELPLEPPPVNAEGQYGMSLNAPHHASKYSPDSMPAAAGTSREMPPPREAQWPEVPEGAQFKQPNVNKRGPEGPHSVLGEGMAQEAAGVTPRAAAGVHVLQPGQMDPTIQHGLRVQTDQPAPKPQTRFEPPRPPEQGPPAPPSGEPIPRERALVPHQSESKQAVSEPPVPGGHTRMYQGERQPPNSFTTDRGIAARYGAVKSVDVSDKQGMPFFTPGREAGTFTTRNNIYRTQSRPVGEIATEPPTRGGAPAGGERLPQGTHQTAPPDLEARLTAQGGLDAQLANRMLNQPAILNQEAAKRGMTPAALKAQAQAAVAAGGVQTPAKGVQTGPREMTWRVKGEDRTVRVSPVPAKPGYTRITHKGKDYTVPNGQLHEKPAKAALPTPEQQKAATGGYATNAGKKIELMRDTDTGAVTTGRIVHETTFKQALDEIGHRKGLLEDATNVVRQAVMKLIGNMPVYVVSRKELARIDQQDAVAYYNRQQNHIVINEAYIGNKAALEHAILHEGIHGITAHALHQNAPLRRLVNMVMRDVLRSELQYLAKTGQTKMRPETKYGFSGNKELDLKNLNEREFIAEAFSNPRFQAMLKDHMLSPATTDMMRAYFGKHPVASAWDALVQSVRRVLKIPDSQMNALEAAMKATDRAIATNEPHKAKYMKAQGVKHKDYSADVESLTGPRFLLGQKLRERDTHRKAGNDEAVTNISTDIRRLRQQIKADETSTSRKPSSEIDPMYGLIDEAEPGKGKGKVIARNKAGEEAGFTGETVHAAATYAKAAGYKPDQIFNDDGSPYTPPKATPPPVATKAAAAAAGAQAAGGAGGKGTPPPLGGAPIPHPAAGAALAAKQQQQQKGFGNAVTKIVNSYKRTFDPARISEHALKGQAPARESRAFFEGEKTRITRAGDEAEKAWSKVPDAERLKALDDYENGRPVDPKHAAYFKDRFGPEMQKAHKEEAQLGSKAAYVEDYVAHEWNRPKAGQAPIGEHFKSMGPTWFQKARTIDFINEGLKAGYTLRNTNPELLLRSRLIAGADMRSKMELLNNWKDIGLAGKAPDAAAKKALTRMGWTELNAPDRAKWMIAPDVQTIWKNGIEAKGLWAAENIGGDAFRGWMAFKAVWVPLKLAASAFHALHVVHINWSANLARAITQASAGDLPGAARSVGKSLAIRSKTGIMGRREWALGEHARTPEGKIAVKLMEEGGFVPMMNEELQTSAKKDFRKAVEDMSIFKTPVHGLRYAIQTIQAPLFEHWIPHLKTAAYLNDVAALLQRRPDLLGDTVNRRVALTEIAKSVDNRFGEMFYGGLFWNRYVKDASIGSFLSLGWNLGFAREFLGAGIETVSRPAQKFIPGLEAHATRKVAQDATNKIAFASVYMATAAALGGAMTWAFTGKPPEEITDYIFPKVGGTNPDGSPRRLTTMFYTREIPMLLKHIQEHGGGIGGVFAGGRDMVWNKMLFQPFIELYTNRSYFGKEIYDTNAPGWEKFLQAGKHVFGEQFSPMSVTGAKRAVETGGDPMKEVPLAFLGFGPAPGYAEKSAMQNRIAHLYREHVAPGARPYQEEATTKAQLKARNDILMARQKNDRPALTAAIRDAVKAGLKEPYILSIAKGEYADQKMFRQLPVTDQLHLMNQASKEELARYKPFAKFETMAKWLKEHPNR